MKKRFVTYCGSALATLALVACPGSEPPVPPSDTQAPSVALQAVEPVSAAGTVTLRAAAADEVGVVEVQFYSGDVLLGSDTSEPYSYDWAVTSANNGQNTITARARDAAGNVGTSEAIQVQVNVPGPVADTEAPTVALEPVTSPVTTAGTLTLKATASDNVGVTEVEFFSGETSLGKEQQAPYAVEWALTSADSGLKTITARARDAAGNVSTSAALQVQVNIAAPDTVAPTVSLEPVASPITTAGTVTLKATASDNVGVTEVQFYNGDTLLGVERQAPYNVDWVLSNASNGQNTITVKALDAAGNVGTSAAAQVQVNIATLVERRVGIAGAALGGGAVLVAQSGASEGNNGQVAKLGKTNATVEITMPSDLVESTYALDLRVRVEEFGGLPDMELTIDGKFYARVSAANKELADLTVNSALATLKPGSKLRARLELDDFGGKRVAYIDSVKLTPATAPPTQTPREPGKFTVQVVKRGLVFPASIAFEPDGKLLLMSRGDPKREVGSSKLYRLDLSTNAFTEIPGMPANVRLAYGGAETFNGGALGLELDADYASNKKLYVCYHYSEGGTRKNRLSSLVIRDNRLQDEKVLIDGAPGGPNHNGCRVAQGPDGTLYLATGDGNTESSPDKLSQNVDSLGGKILRVNPDGSVPTDNPYPGAGNSKFVWTLGHRNPQGLAFQPGSGLLWATEHGPASDDELNVIERGKNYGWPFCDGSVTSCPGVTTGTYKPAVDGFYGSPQFSTIAPSDIAFYTGAAFPEWQGDLFLVTLKTGRLIRYDVSGQAIVNREGSTLLSMTTPNDPYYNQNYGRFRDVAMGPDGFIYVITEPTNADLAGKPEFGNIRPPNPDAGFLLRIRP